MASPVILLIVDYRAVIGGQDPRRPRATLSYAHVRYTCDGNISTEVEVSATFCSAFMGPNRTDRRKNNTTPALEKEGRILKEQTQITSVTSYVQSSVA